MDPLVASGPGVETGEAGRSEDEPPDAVLVPASVLSGPSATNGLPEANTSAISATHMSVRRRNDRWKGLVLVWSSMPGTLTPLATDDYQAIPQILGETHRLP